MIENGAHRRLHSSIFSHEQLKLLILVVIVHLMLLQGCVVFLSTVAMITRVDGTNSFTATMLVPKTTTSVYDAISQLIEQSPEAFITATLPQTYRIEALIMDTETLIKATPYGSRLTQLLLTMEAGHDDVEVKEYALLLFENTCKNLGAKCDKSTNGN